MNRIDEFILHHNIPKWGNEILIMHEDGIAFARIYWYNDDDKVVYLDSLSVNDSHTNRGIGTKLQEIREQLGRNMGASVSNLWVEKDSWMYNWYQRRGYVESYDHEEPGHVWMRKELFG